MFVMLICYLVMLLVYGLLRCCLFCCYCCLIVLCIAVVYYLLFVFVICLLTLPLGCLVFGYCWLQWFTAGFFRFRIVFDI